MVQFLSWRMANGKSNLYRDKPLHLRNPYCCRRVLIKQNTKCTSTIWASVRFNPRFIRCQHHHHYTQSSTLLPLRHGREVITSIVGERRTSDVVLGVKRSNNSHKHSSSAKVIIIRNIKRFVFHSANRGGDGMSDWSDVSRTRPTAAFEFKKSSQEPNNNHNRSTLRRGYDPLFTACNSPLSLKMILVMVTFVMTVIIARIPWCMNLRASTARRLVGLAWSNPNLCGHVSLATTNSSTLCYIERSTAIECKCTIVRIVPGTHTSSESFTWLRVCMGTRYILQEFLCCQMWRWRH